MKNIQSIEQNASSKEELLPDFTEDFPYIATCAQMCHYQDSSIPWHWHRTVELFYIQSGTLEYTTPKGKWTFPAGSGGMVNSNVLHSTNFQHTKNSTVQLLHLFDPAFLAGGHGSRMETKYILPLTTAPGVELIPLFPEDPEQADMLHKIREAFELSEQEWGYELKLREMLSRIWLKLFDLARPGMQQGGKNSDDKIKALMVYIHEHYQDPIRVEELAESVHISKRACFRLFQDNLHTTPVEYIRSYRLQTACQMLVNTTDSVTQIAYRCGLGSSSYFGKVFREAYHCTPMEYRRAWHDRDKIRH